MIHTSLKPKILLVYFGLISCLCVTPVKAQDTTQDDAPLPSIKVLEPLDETRDMLSQQVVRFADWIDTFFAGDRVYDELQDSYVKLYLLQTNYEHDKPTYDAQLKAKLVFPKTQKRLKLLIESEDEDEETDQQSISDVREEQEQSVGLRLIQKDTERWRIQTDGLFRYNSGIETVARIRFRRKAIRGPWIFRFSETIFWYSKEGLGERTRFSMDRVLTENLLFRSTTYATWRNANLYFNYGQRFSLFQDISKRKALTYEASVRGITEDKPHATDYLLSVKYREQIHKGWLFYELIPQINYPIEEDFKPTRSISLKLEVVFDSQIL